MSTKTINELETFWNSFQPDYESRLGQTMTLFNHSLIHMMQTKTASKFLEMGCGPGLGTLSLHRRLQDEKNFSASITACDLSPAMIECAKKRLPQSVQLQVANNLDLPFEDSSFDRVMAGMNLNLVPDPSIMLDQMFRVLQPGGRVGISVWGRAEESFALTVFNSACQKLGIELPSVRSNFHLGTKEVLVPLVKAAGFCDVLAWHVPTVYNESTAEEYAMTLYSAPNRQNLIKTLSKERFDELHQTLVDLINEKLLVSEEPLQLDGLIVVGNKAN
jgi:ubiquinone/menaquinone biosynthesis C-methylase UbiE